MALLDKYELTRTVVMDNQMLRTEYYTQSELELTANQKKLLVYLISRINDGDTELKEETIAMKDYCELFGINWDGGHNQVQLRKSMLSLSKKCFVLPIAPGVEKMFRWIGTFELDYNTNTIRIKLDDSLKPYYLGLKQNFTIYQLGYVTGFSSRYSYTIYEYLKSKANLKFCTISVDDARRQFAYGKYPNFANFKTNVLDIAIKEINSKSDLTVRYKATKKGKSYDTITFSITKKTGAALEKVSKWKTITKPTKTEEMENLFDTFEEQMHFADMDYPESNDIDDFDTQTVDFSEVT